MPIRKKPLCPEEISPEHCQYYDFERQKNIEGSLQIWTTCPKCHKQRWTKCTAVRRGYVSSPICKNCIGLVNLPKEPVNLIATQELLDRILAKAKELGRNPKAPEVTGKSTIIKRFGSWNAALFVAGLIPSLRNNIYFRPPFSYGSAPDIPDSLGYFLAGFVAGEGCFSINRSTQETVNRGKVTYFNPSFAVGLHNSDIAILETFLQIFPCGHIYQKTQTISHFIVMGIENATRYVIPFFRKFAFRNTFKQHQFDRWCQVVELLNQNAHLTKDGCEQMKQQTSRINSRKYLPSQPLRQL